MPLAAIMLNNGLIDGDTAYLLLDTSGGVFSDTKRIVAEGLTGLLVLKNFKLVVISFDTEVMDVREFTKDNIDTFVSFPVRGGGGSKFYPAFQYIMNHWHWMTPAKVFLFSDGINTDDFSPNPAWFNIVRISNHCP